MHFRVLLRQPMYANFACMPKCYVRHSCTDFYKKLVIQKIIVTRQRRRESGFDLGKTANSTGEHSNFTKKKTLPASSIPFISTAFWDSNWKGNSF